MSDEPELGRYEREPTRVRAGSGKPWLAVWGAVAVAVVTISVAWTALTRTVPPTSTTTPDEAVVASPEPSQAPVVPSDAPSPRATSRLIVESTDFYANGGAAYYGIGGRLIRALAPVPTRTPNPGDAPQ